MNFSLQQPAAPTATSPRPAGWDLPQAQRPTRRKSSTRKVLLIGGVLGLGAAGVWAAGAMPGTTKSLKGLFASTQASVLTYPVRRAKLPVVVKEKGNLESSLNIDVFCEVEGAQGSTIIMILPEGSRVKKGDLVCELDSSTLKDNLTNQKITTQQAEASHKNAQLTLEVARIAVIEYIEGTFKQDKQTAEGEIALAKSDMKRAEDRLDWTERMHKKDYASLAQLISEQFALQKAKFTAEQAQTKLNVLLKYSKDKQVKELSAEVEKATADERAKMATLDLERSKEAKLERQIAKCRITAPSDGLVVYANDPNRFGGQQTPQIEEGASVRERQKIFSLPDVTHMRVNTKVHESMVDRMSSGLRARIRVDALPDQLLSGTVASVAPLPDPNNMFSSDIKVYTTLVSIDKSLPQLRPGMTAQVEILVTELPDAIGVPVQAVVQAKGKEFVTVWTPNGPKRKPITLGISNDQLVEVKEGLQPGDLVVLDPKSLMSDDEKRELFGGPGQGDGKAGEWGSAAAKKDMGPGGPAVAPGKDGAGGPPAKAKGKGKRGGGGFNPAIGQKMQKLGPEEKAKLFTGSPEEQEQVMKAAGFTDEEMQQMQQMRQMRQQGGGGFGPPGGGGPPGGSGGGAGQ